MKKLTIILFTLFVVSAGFAADATQTDWSGGDGVAGPVSDWADKFDASTDINGAGIPGVLRLDYTSIEHVIDDNFDGARYVCSVDIDGDGDLDVLVAASGADDIAWWENDGSGGGWIKHTVDDNFDGVRSVHSADVDGDGYMDVLGAAYTADDITWWRNTDGSGTNWVEHTVADNFDSAGSVYSIDMDNDGDLDILGAAWRPEDVIWWENTNGVGTNWVEHVVEDSVSCLCVLPADIDGDGDMDVLGGAYRDDDIVWWENTNGSGTSWIKHLIDNDFNCAFSVYSADVDGDGDLDALGAAYGAGGLVAWWENDGSGGGWIKHTVDTFRFGHSVYSADVDGDGDVDVLSASYVDDDVVWWENDGTSNGWTKHTVADNFDGARYACAADLDGNGEMDVLAAAGKDDDVTWWEVTQFKASGNLTSSILDTAALPEWGQISWTEDIPTDTTVSVEVRASNDSDSMGSWLAVSSGDELGDYLTDYDLYFQYKIALATSDTDASPTFEDITINWTDCTAVESVDLYTNARDDGVLLSWSIVGDEPASVRVLRGLTQNGSVDLSGELTGSATSWLDVSVEAGVEYAYYLEVTELDGTVSRFGPSEVVVPGMVSELALSDPYPNPADESLTIHYELTQNATVKLHIYDVAGRLVETLVSGEQTAGRHSVNWDSSTSATGVYLLRLEANGEALTKRAVISR